MIKKNKGGRPRGEPKVTISFKVPVDKKEYIHTQVTMLIKKILKK